MDYDIRVNGVPVVISAAYVSGSDDTFYGLQFVGEYNSLRELNKDMSRLIDQLPSAHHWLEFDFQDKIEE